MRGRGAAVARFLQSPHTMHQLEAPPAALREWTGRVHLRQRVDDRTLPQRNKHRNTSKIHIEAQLVETS